MFEVVGPAIPVFVFFMLVEYFVGRHRGEHVYETKDTAASLSMGVGNVLLSVGIDLVLLAALVLVYQVRLFDIEMNTWWSWLLAFVLFDFLFYWMHRLHHEVRVFWAAHVNHHSSERYNLSTALRQSWTEPLTSIPFWVVMSLVGFPPHVTLLVHAISLLYQFTLHTEVVGKLGPLEWVWNTPSHHRVHHGSDLKYLDRNYGGMLIIWDRLFGSFQVEEEPVTYGLTTNIDTYNPLKIAFHEWAAIGRDMRQAERWGDRLQILIQPPGWRPGDDSQTVRVLQGRAPSRLVSKEEHGDETDAAHATPSATFFAPEDPATAAIGGDGPHDPRRSGAGS